MPKKLRFKPMLFLFVYIWYRCVFSYVFLSMDVSFYGRNIVLKPLFRIIINNIYFVLKNYLFNNRC